MQDARKVEPELFAAGLQQARSFKKTSRSKRFAKTFPKAAFGKGKSSFGTVPKGGPFESKNLHWDANALLKNALS